MMYMMPQTKEMVACDTRHNLGQIFTPVSFETRPLGLWVADNGAFSGTVTPNQFLRWLERVRPHRATCLFAVAPDVVADAVATLDRFRFYGWRVRSLGFPVALVAQDGLESLPWPPPEQYDALFVGGSTGWKLSEAAVRCIRQAQSLGKWTHAGRVNSRKRYQMFRRIGVDSCDGTHVVFKPSVRFRQIQKWVAQPSLFE